MSKLRSFKGGIHPEHDGKALSASCPVIKAPLLEKYQVILPENFGRPPLPCVAKNEKVLKYQCIAEADGFVSVPLHAPTSGTVTAITEVPGPMGVPVQAVEITSDGEDRGEAPFEKWENWRERSAEELMTRIREAGIVGMGGAAFPAHVKLSVPPGKKVDTLIINGAECEPYLTADHRLMAESPEKVITGAAIMQKILNAEKVIIGVEANKPDAIAALESAAAGSGIAVMPLKVQYPQGAEKQLIYAVTRRCVPCGGLPFDAGCVVQNTGSAAAVCEAVLEGIPLIERIVTVSGEAVRSPGNFKLRIGTPLIEAVKLAGGVTEEPGKLILGGPMMGFAQRSFDVPVCKNTSGILLFPERAALNFTSSPCIRCGRCVAACPMKLQPCLLCAAIEGKRFDLAQKGHVMDCMECGACSYICPARRPLVQQFRRAKAELRRKK